MVYQLNRLSNIVWIQKQQNPNHSGQKSNDWVRCSMISIQTGTTYTRHNGAPRKQSHTTNLSCSLRSPWRMASYFSAIVKMNDGNQLQVRPSSVFTQDFCPQQRTPLWQHVKVLYWNLMRMGSEKRRQIAKMAFSRSNPLLALR